MNIRFLAQALRQISIATSERALSAAGPPHAQAVLDVDSLIWRGVRTRDERVS